MATTIALLLVSLLSTATNSQITPCQIIQKTNCRSSPYDLKSYALVQTISPIACISDPITSSSFTLESFGVEFVVTTTAGDQSIDIQLIIFLPNPLSTGSGLQNFDTTSAENNVLFSQNYMNVGVNSGFFSYQFSPIAFSYPPCPPNMAIFINVMRVGGGISSIAMQECEKDTMEINIAPGSTLFYYDATSGTNTLMGIIGSASVDNSPGYGLKLDPLSVNPSPDICTVGPVTGGSCGDGTINGMCIDQCLSVPNGYISQVGEKWIQFISQPNDCNPIEMYINGIAVYLENPNIGGFKMDFTMKIKSINGDVVSQIDELTNNGANEAQPNSYTSTVSIDDVMFDANNFYQMYFAFPAIEPIRDYYNRQYFWELELTYNERQGVGYGVSIIGCDGITYDKTINYFMDQYLEQDVHISYRMDAMCNNGGNINDYCYGAEWLNINAVIVPTPSNRATKSAWEMNQDTLKNQCGWAFFEMMMHGEQSTTNPVKNYCFDAWNSANDCNCLTIDHFQMFFDGNNQYVTQFEIQFQVNSDLMQLTDTGSEFDVEIAKQDFAQRIWDSLSGATASTWFDNIIQFDVLVFDMGSQECGGETSYFVTVVVEYDDDNTARNGWQDNEETLKSECGIAFLDAITYNTKLNYCFDPWMPENDCGCLVIHNFDINLDGNPVLSITFDVNSDVYKLTQEDTGWSQAKAEDGFVDLLYNSLSMHSDWFSPGGILEVITFEFEPSTCPHTGLNKLLKIEFEIVTDILYSEWLNNIDIVQEACETSFINIMSTLLGEIMDSRCFSFLTQIEDLSGSDRRRLLAGDTGIKLEIEFNVNENIYDSAFNDPNFDKNEFGANFMTQFDSTLQTMNDDNTINWYTDSEAQYKLDEVEIVSDDNAEAAANVQFVNFKDDPMQIGISIVLLLALTIGVFGYLNSICRGADNFKYSSIFFFGLYTWDFFSDVFFSALLYTSKLQNSDYTGAIKWIFWFIFAASVFFIVLPVLLNFKSLLSFQRKWQEDKLHADRYRAWLAQYANILFFLSFLSGSTFGAIALVNSNLLGLRLFAMGLSNKDMREFNQKRLANVVIGENLPQLLVQIVYTGVSSQFELVAFLAICSSAISIVAAVYSFYSNRGFLQDTNVQESLFSIKVTCGQTEFIKHPGHYKNKTYVLATEIARIFPLDRSCVEILPTEKFADKNNDGLMLYFFVATSKKQPTAIYLDLQSAIDIEENKKVSQLGKQIAKAWGLQWGDQCSNEQQVKTYGLQWINKDLMDGNTAGDSTIATGGQNVELSKVNSKTNLTNTNESIAPGESGVLEGKNDNLPLAVAHTSENSTANVADFEMINVDEIKDKDVNENCDSNDQTDMV